MKRVDIPPTETDGSEPLVRITDRVPRITRLYHGVAAFQAGLRALQGYGLKGRYGPEEVEDVLTSLRVTGTNARVTGDHGWSEWRRTVELTPPQAEIAHVAAQTMLAEAIRFAHQEEAFGADGELGPPATGYEEWKIIAAALAPPSPPETPAP